MPPLAAVPDLDAELDDIVARAEADAEFRDRLVADLESALAAEGIEPDPQILQALRERLGSE